MPDAADPHTQTNRQLIDRVRPAAGSTLFVAGEAASHCVAATVADLFVAFTAAERARVVVLRDCMSPVGGFEAQGQAFFDRVRQQGAGVATTAEHLAARRSA